MIAVILITILSGFAYFAYWCIREKQKYKSLDHVPGPPCLPVVGNALEFRSNGVDKLNALTRFFKEYGPTIKFWIGPTRFYLCTTDPELTEFFVSSLQYLKKAHDYTLLKPWLGNGLLLSTGNHWQKRRKMITPAFHFKILGEFIPVFNSAGEILVQKLNQEIGKDVTDIYSYITTYALDVICETAMGTSVNAQNDPSNEYIQSVQTFSRVFIERVFSPWKMFDSLFQFSNDYKIQKKALKILHDFTDTVIVKRRELLLQDVNKGKEEIVDELGRKKRTAFLDVLLKSTIDGKPLKDEEIREEVDTFMFEGHDTTASGISFALYELSRHPEIQAKCVEELKDIFGNNIKRPATIEDFNNMKYIELVIKETLRLYPSVPFYARELTKDVTHNGVLYPKGANISFMVMHMHRRSSIFKNPDEFNPNRFLFDKDENRSPFAYLPFSAGPRNCIGQKFAMYELKSTISKVLLNYVLKPVDSKYDVILSGETILKSANGVSLKLERRKFY